MTKRSLGLIGMTAVLVVTACGINDTAWRARLDTPETKRLEGLWNIEMSTGGATAHGTLAILVNRAERPTLWHRSPPELKGTHNIAVSQLSLAPVADNLSILTARAWGDSVELWLNPDADGGEVWLRGTWREDTVRGDWAWRSRSGPARSGTFQMSRAKTGA